MSRRRLVQCTGYEPRRAISGRTIQQQASDRSQYGQPLQPCSLGAPRRRRTLRSWVTRVSITHPRSTQRRKVVWGGGAAAAQHVRLSVFNLRFGSPGGTRTRRSGQGPRRYRTGAYWSVLSDLRFSGSRSRSCREPPARAMNKVCRRRAAKQPGTFAGHARGRAGERPSIASADAIGTHASRASHTSHGAAPRQLSVPAKSKGHVRSCRSSMTRLQFNVARPRTPLREPEERTRTPTCDVSHAWERGSFGAWPTRGTRTPGGTPSGASQASHALRALRALRRVRTRARCQHQRPARLARRMLSVLRQGTRGRCSGPRTALCTTAWE